MFGFASRFKVNISVVAGCAGSLERSVLLFLRQLLKALVNRLRHQRALLHPAFDATRRAYSRKPLFAFEYLDSISVLDHAGLAENCGYAVAKYHLRCRDVGDLLHPASSTATGEERERN